jgi:hypothetical protein
VSTTRSGSGQLTALMLLGIAALGALFLAWIGIDALEGRNHFQFFADSETYHAAARGEFVGLDSTGDFIGVSGNFLGPAFLVRLLGGNYYLIMLFNVLVLYFSAASMARSLHLDVLRFTAVLLLNPITVSSLLSVNKEIISVAFLALLLVAYTRRSFIALVCAALISILVRWQLLLFLLVLLGFTTQLNPLRHRRLTLLIMLLIGMSLLYVLLSPVFEAIRQSVERTAGEYQGSGFFDWASSIEERGGYALVFPLKALHLLFGLGLRFDRLFAPVDIYNDVWQLLHSTASLVMFLLLCLSRRVSLRNDLIYLSVVYIVVFSISPIYSPRYFYPVYVLWAAVLLSSPRPVRILHDGNGRTVRRPRVSAGSEPAAADPLPGAGL